MQQNVSKIFAHVWCFKHAYLHTQTAIHPHLKNHRYFDCGKKPAYPGNERHASIKMVQVLRSQVYICNLYTTLVKSIHQSMWKMWLNHKYTSEIPELAPSLSQHGAQFRGLRGFLVIKILVSGAYVTASAAVHAWREHISKMPYGVKIVSALIFACMVGKNPQTLKLSPIADNAIIRGSIGGLGSLVYICGLNANPFVTYLKRKLKELFLLYVSFLLRQVIQKRKKRTNKPTCCTYLNQPYLGYWEPQMLMCHLSILYIQVQNLKRAGTDQCLSIPEGRSHGTHVLDLVVLSKETRRQRNLLV